MNYNIIKQFVDQFNNCPKCNHPLKIEAEQDNGEHNSIFFVSTNNEQITINATSNYFVNPNQETYKFSISLIDGNVLYSNTTSHFVSLYDLDIFLYKDCKKCAKMALPEIFHQSVKLFYDRATSSFCVKPWCDIFSFYYNNNLYRFVNSLANMQSSLSIKSLIHQNDRTPITNIPFTPFTKFSFNNREKLAEKINSMLLLI